MPELLESPRDLVQVDEEFRSGVRRAVQDDWLYGVACGGGCPGLGGFGVDVFEHAAAH